MTMAYNSQGGATPVRINYGVLHAYAVRHRLTFSELCTTVRAALGVDDGPAVSDDQAQEPASKVPPCPREALAVNEDLTRYLYERLSRAYVQRADARQRAMGLQYTTAETHDLAATVARWVVEYDGEVDRVQR